MTSRSKLAPRVLVPLFIGLVGFSNVARQPRFDTFRAVDVLQLIGTGMCFGAALIAVVIFFRTPRSSS